MTGRIGRHRWLVVVGVLALAVLTWAWIDGGERALAPISEVVVLPEISQ